MIKNELIILKEEKLKLLIEMLENNKKLAGLINDEDDELLLKNLQLDKHYIRVIESLDDKIDNILKENKDNFLEDKDIKELDNMIKSTLLEIQELTKKNTMKLKEEMNNSQFKFRKVKKSVKALKIYNQNSRV